MQMLVLKHAMLMETDAKLWLGMTQMVCALVTTNTLEVAFYLTIGELTMLIQTILNLPQFAEARIQKETRISWQPHWEHSPLLISACSHARVSTIANL